MRNPTEFTDAENSLIGDIIRFTLEKQENRADAILIEKFGEPALVLVKEWCASALEWERTKEERIQEIIKRYTKKSNPV